MSANDRSRFGFGALFLLLMALVLAIAPVDAAPAAQQAPDPILERINGYRLAAGVGPAQIHPALVQAAAGHVAYYEANKGDPSLAGMGLHQQRPGAQGFTGATMGDRARAAGYTAGTVTENAGFGRIEAALDWYMHTVNHRLPLVHPSALEFGYAAASSPGFNIVNVGLRRDRLNVPLPSVYPADGAVDVPTTWDGSEAPDPAPGLPRPLGYPLTVAFALHQQVEWRTLELRSAAGEPLAVSTPRKEWMRAAAIIPHRPLGPGQTYLARVEAVVDGATIVKEWRFTTRP